MSGATRGFPTAPDDVAAIAAALIGDPILYQPVLLGQLGPDLMGGGFGMCGLLFLTICLQKRWVGKLCCGLKTPM
jgi:hypothetical protein